MYIPAVRERVAISGQAGVFFVVGVNREAEIADLVALVSHSFVEENVPFSTIQPYPDAYADWS
jgi:hypothetical protein